MAKGKILRKLWWKEKVTKSIRNIRRDNVAEVSHQSLLLFVRILKRKFKEKIADKKFKRKIKKFFIGSKIQLLVSYTSHRLLK